MAFNDPFGVVFPTREGATVGTGEENRMLQKVGGASGFRKAYLTLNDGSVVRLTTRNGMPEFVLDRSMTAGPNAKAYMTSGAYAVGTYFVKEPEQTKDFVVYKNDSVDAVEKSAFASFFKPPVPANGAASRIYTKFAQGGMGLTSAAAILKGMPASNFTGLARRFMQGRYGCGTYVEAAEAFVFGYDYANTTGVINLGGEYWLLSLKTSASVLSVFARRLIIPAVYQARLAGLIGSAYDAMEILCFGNARISTTEITVGTFEVPKGDPLAYGWKFSLTTNKADIVLREVTNTAHDKNMWTHLSLTFSSGQGAPTCKISTVEQTTGWMLATRSPIWVPGETTIMANWRSNNSDPDAPQNCPIYCYYNDDALRVFRWTYAKSGKAYSSEEWIDMLTAAKCANNIFPVGVATADAAYTWGDVYTYGMFCGEVSNVKTSGESSISYTGSVTGYWVPGEFGSEPDMTPPVTPVTPILMPSAIANWFFSGGQWTNLNPYNHPNGCVPAFTMYPGDHYQFYRLYYVEARMYREYKHISAHLFTTPFIIPAGDACAAYVGRKETYTSTNTTTISYLRGPGRSVEWDMDYASGPPMYRSKGLWGEPVSVQINNYENNGVLDGVTKEDSGTQTVTTPVSEYTLRLHVNNSVIDANGEASIIYNPSANEISLPIQVRVISPSLFSGYKCHSGTLCVDDTVLSGGGYPISIDSFIGAS